MGWCTDWKDGFGVNRSKQQRKHTDGWTFTIATPRSNVNGMENAMAISIGLKKNQSWRITGEADRINFDPELWDLLSGKGDANSLQPAHVQFALLPLIAADAGRKVYCQSRENTVSVEI